MTGPDLLSKEWCNLIFQGKNKEYGAYCLRRDAGRRYRRALWCVAGGVCLLIVPPLLLDLYVKYTIRKSLEDVSAQVRMKPLEPEKGHEFKAVSAGRRAVPHMKPGATTQAPTIVDDIVLPRPIGIDGPAVLEEAEALLVQADADTTHNTDRTDMPVEGIQLLPTDIVEQLPDFPGGPGELMKWLDQNIIYPKSCVDAKIEGDAEIAFYVMTDGTVSEPAITKKLHPDIDRAILMAIKRMPKWKPGHVNGKPSVVRVSVPVHFQLQ